MDIKLIKKLIDECGVKGSAKYRMYTLIHVGSGYELMMNGKLIARFIITGYEQGFLEVNLSETPYQIKTVESLKTYLTGGRTTKEVN